MKGGSILAGLGAYVRRHHLGLLALIVALSGTAYAAQKSVAPKNSVVTKSIKKRAVTRPKLARDSVDGSKVLNRSLTGADIDLATLGGVPSAAHATSADEATNAAQLGGAPASAYVTAASASAGALTLKSTAGCPTAGLGPTVTIDVPADGVLEVLARAQIGLTSGLATGCIRADGGGSIQVFSTTLAGIYFTKTGSSTGTTASVDSGWLVLFSSQGRHTIELGFGLSGGGAATIDKQLLIARAVP